MKEYRQLTLPERYEIAALKKTGHSQAAIAAQIGVSPSTISRALRRNRSSSGYYGQAADQKAHHRRQQARRPTKWTAQLAGQIHAKLAQQWSPEQISGWMKRTQPRWVSHERIYQYLRADQRAGGTAYKQLRRRLGPRRPPRLKRYRGSLRDRVSIDRRPALVAHRSRIGDWEADLMSGGHGGGALLTVVERKSRFTCIARLPSKHSPVVAQALIDLLTPYKRWIETITLDNGNEFAQHATVGKALEAQIYFAHPYCAWQRGLNENTNGLLRQYFPKGTYFKTLHLGTLRKIERRLNQRPRKALAFRTPYQIFHEERS